MAHPAAHRVPTRADWRRVLPPELALAAVAASFAAPFIRWADAPPLVTGSGRTLLAFCIALVPALRAVRGSRRGPRPVWRAWGLRPSDLAWASVAAVALAVHFATWITGLGQTSVASAVVLVDAHPLLVLGAEALWLHRAVHARAWGGALLALVGVGILAGGDLAVGGTRALTGDALSFAGAVTTAIYVLAGARVRQRVPNSVYVAFLYGTCAALLAAGAAAFGQPWPSLAHPVPAWTGFLLLALVPTTLGHTLVNRVLAYVRTGYVSVVLLGEPLLATVWTALWFHQIPTPPEALGGALAVTGMAMVLWPESSPSEPTATHPPEAAGGDAPQPLPAETAAPDPPR